MSLPLYPDLPGTLAAASLDLQKQFGADLSEYAIFVSRAEPKGAKVINDPIWRTVRLEPWEAIVVDSPLFQRLRRIRQLGLVGYVYPGAGYSRFEHSIGVLHQSQRVIEALNRNSRALSLRKGIPPDVPVPPFEETRLRLAALLHDVGHGFMSHVSERAIEGMLRVGGEKLSVLRHEAAQFFSCPKPPALAEVMSALLILLPEFREVLAKARVPDWDDTHALAYGIGRVIVGGRDAKRPFLTEILSGSTDADKLDYMPRDCYMAGLPMPVDVDRLLEKLLVVDFPASELPEPYRELFELAEDDLVRVLAVQATGIRAFDELVVSRALLFQKLYHHQKVRAMEGMVTNAIELLVSESAEFQKLSTYLQLADDEFLLGNWPVSPKTGASERARRLVKDVVSRRPFVRAMAFGPTLVTGDWSALSAFVTDKGRTDLRQELAERVKEYLTKSGQPGLAEGVDQASFLIDLPDVQGIVARTRLFIFDEQLGPRIYGERHEARRWTEAYEAQTTRGYVYCPVEFATAAYLAFRDIATERFGVEFRPESWSLAKLSAAELKALSTRLLANQAKTLAFTLPETARLPARTRNIDSSKRELVHRYTGTINELEHRFRTYKSSNNRVASSTEIKDWLMQFSHDEIPLAMKALTGISFWDRAALADALAAGIEGLGHAKLSTIQVSGLGSATTSAHHLSYLWDDIKARIGPKVNVLPSLDKLVEGIPLLLFDDNVGSGGQSSTVFMQWCGLPQDQWFVQEKHVEALSEATLKKLRECEVSICYVTGWRSGLARVLDVAGKLLNSRPEGLIVAPTDLPCFGAAARIWSTQEEANRAMSVFSTAGIRALQDRLVEKNAEWINERALGYGNAAGLTVFYYNTPTTTLTALWKDGEQVDSRWMALFPRRAR